VEEGAFFLVGFDEDEVDGWRNQLKGQAGEAGTCTDVGQPTCNWAEVDGRYALPEVKFDDFGGIIEGSEGDFLVPHE